MRTNREFYKALEGLLQERRGPQGLSLEDYLCSLRVRAARRKDETHLSLDTLFALLAEAFSPATGAPEERGEIHEDATGFLGWDAVVRRQIQDLREMQKNGQLEDEQRYFGIDAPSGHRWYNFDPCSYLECGTVGSLGGWEEGDQTGREYVPGQVAVVNGQGDIVTCDPHDLDPPPRAVAGISWDQFKDLLWCGQQYE